MSAADGMTGLPWFPCDARKLLGELSGMIPDEQLVYVICMLRIHEVGGPISDDERALARRTGLTVNRVAKALERLLAHGKLTKAADGYVSESAKATIADQKRRMTDLSERQSRRAKERWRSEKKDHSNQQTDDATAQPSQRSGTSTAMPDDAHLHSHKQSKELRSLDSKRGTRLPDKWQPSDSDIEFAASKGLTAEALANQVEKFRNYWLSKAGKDATKLDWSMTWRNRVIDWKQYHGEPSNNSRSSRGANSTRADATLAGLAEHHNEKFGASPPIR